MDRADAAMEARDPEALTACYAEDAVVTTPDQGDVTGRAAIRTWFDEFARAFPDFRYEYTHRYEAGDVVVAGLPLPDRLFELGQALGVLEQQVADGGA